MINYICLGSGGNSASNKPWRNCCCKEYKLELLKGARCSNGTDARISGLLVRFCVWPGGGGGGHNEMLVCRLELREQFVEGRASCL